MQKSAKRIQKIIIRPVDWYQYFFKPEWYYPRCLILKFLQMGKLKARMEMKKDMLAVNEILSN